MPTRRGLLAALAAGLAGCRGRRRTDRRTPAPPPMDYEPGTPSTPEPRSSPLPIDDTFRWLAPYYDAANTCDVPTTGPTGTPEVQWEVWLPNVHRSEHALIDGESLLVFGDGRLATIDRRTGELERTVSLAVDPRTAPTLTDDGIVSGAMTAEDTPGVALQTVDGETRWRRGDGNLVIPPVVDDGRLSVPADAELVCRSLEDGAVRWRRPTEGAARRGDDIDVPTERFVTTPAVADGTVYGQSTDGLYAIDAETGERRWRRTTGTDHSPTTAVAVGDRFAFVGFEGGRGTVAFERADGAPAWDSEAGVPIGTHARVGDRIVTGSATGTVFGLSAERGAVDWDAPAGVGHPVIAGETAYVRGEQGEEGIGGVVALSLEDGSRRFHLPVGGDGWLLVADGYCYLNRGEGVVQCLG